MRATALFVQVIVSAQQLAEMMLPTIVTRLPVNASLRNAQELAPFLLRPRITVPLSLKLAKVELARQHLDAQQKSTPVDQR
jgi:hypothetical protein